MERRVRDERIRHRRQRVDRRAFLALDQIERPARLEMPLHHQCCTVRESGRHRVDRAIGPEQRNGDEHAVTRHQPLALADVEPVLDHSEVVERHGLGPVARAGSVEDDGRIGGSRAFIRRHARLAFHPRQCPNRPRSPRLPACRREPRSPTLDGRRWLAEQQWSRQSRDRGSGGWQTAIALPSRCSRKSSSLGVDQVLNGTATAPTAAAAKNTSSHSTRLSQSSPILSPRRTPNPRRRRATPCARASRAEYETLPLAVIARAVCGAAAACSRSSSNIVRLMGFCICYSGQTRMPGKRYQSR